MFKIYRKLKDGTKKLLSKTDDKETHESNLAGFAHLFNRRNLRLR